VQSLVFWRGDILIGHLWRGEKPFERLMTGARVTDIEELGLVP
jgi:hypothetical protein